MFSTPEVSYKLYRVMLNSRGDGVSVSGHEVYYDHDQAVDAVTARWAKDNMKSSVEWKAINQLTGRTVGSKRADKGAAIS